MVATSLRATPCMHVPFSTQRSREPPTTHTTTPLHGPRVRRTRCGCAHASHRRWYNRLQRQPQTPPRLVGPFSLSTTTIFTPRQTASKCTPTPIRAEKHRGRRHRCDPHRHFCNFVRAFCRDASVLTVRCAFNALPLSGDSFCSTSHCWPFPPPCPPRARASARPPITRPAAGAAWYRSVRTYTILCTRRKITWLGGENRLLSVKRDDRRSHTRPSVSVCDPCRPLSTTSPRRGLATTASTNIPASRLPPRLFPPRDFPWCNVTWRPHLSRPRHATMVVKKDLGSWSFNAVELLTKVPFACAGTAHVL